LTGCFQADRARLNRVFRSAPLVLALSILLAASCEPAPPPDPGQLWEACLGGEYAPAGVNPRSGESEDVQDYSSVEGVAGYEDGECDRPDDLLEGTHRVRLLAEANLDARYLAEGLQRYYRRHGLRLSASVEPGSIRLPYLLDNDRAGLDEALRCAFPEIDLGEGNSGGYPEAVETFAVNYILRPVRRFLEAWRNADPGTTDVVAVERILRLADDREGEIAGLAISARYLTALRRSGSPEAEVWRGVQLPADFNSTVFVVAPTAVVPPEPARVSMDLTLAHELAHTTGLLHSSAPGNLMVASLDPLSASCRRGLQPAQLATMASAFRGSGTSAAAGLPLLAEPGPASSAAAAAPREALRRWLQGERRAFSGFARRMFHAGGL
jgi:hypothetical protein